jgi:hypothetical protein
VDLASVQSRSRHKILFFARKAHDEEKAMSCGQESDAKNQRRRVRGNNPGRTVRNPDFVGTANKAPQGICRRKKLHRGRNGIYGKARLANNRHAGISKPASNRSSTQKKGRSIVTGHSMTTGFRASARILPLANCPRA